MATIFIDSGSFNGIQVTGSTLMSSSTGVVLQLKGNGNTIFSISGSRGDLFSISDFGSSTSLFSVTSASVTILNINEDKSINLSGSVSITGSLISNQITGSLFGTASYVTGSTFNSTNPALSSSYAVTASYALNGGGGPAVLTGGKDGYMAIWSGSNSLTSSIISQVNSVPIFTGNSINIADIIGWSGDNNVYGGNVVIPNFEIQVINSGSLGYINDITDGGNFPLPQIWTNITLTDGGLNSVTINDPYYSDISSIAFYSQSFDGFYTIFFSSSILPGKEFPDTIYQTVSYTVPTTFIEGNQTVSRSLSVTESITVGTSQSPSFFVNNQGSRIGNLVTNIHRVTGSFNVSGSSHRITGSLLATVTGSLSGNVVGNLTGTSSWSTSALTASSAEDFNIRGRLSVSGNISLGDASTDTLTLVANSVTLGTGNGTLNIDSNTLYVDGANSRIGLGTSSPTYAFQINQPSQAQVLNVNNILYITSSNVGINSPNPTFSFEVSGSNNVVRIIGSGSRIISGSNRPIFTVEGSTGELIRSIDTSTGSLFVVNSAVGTPIIEVNSNGRVMIGTQPSPALYTSIGRIIDQQSGALYALSTSSYDAIFVDYAIRSGSASRVGQITAMRSASAMIAQETSVSSSILASTSSVKLSITVSGSNMVLSGSMPTDTWTLKAIIKSI